jgi:hypothetical protein
MARTVSFSPYQGDTIKALQARQQQLARVQPLIPTSTITNPLQGAASVVDTLANEINAARAKRDEHQAVQGMAQLMGSFGPDGPSQEQIGQLAGYDPDTAIKLYEKRQELLADQARLKAQQEFSVSERLAGQDFTRSQTDAGYAHEGTVDARELGQEQAMTKATQEQEAAVNARELQEQKDKEARDAQAGQLTTVTGDEATKRGLDPKRTWQVDPQGKATDITPAQQETFGPLISGAEAEKLGLDHSKQYQLNEKTKKYDPVGGSGVTIQNVPAETAAKIALGDEFLSNFDSIRLAAVNGDMTGPLDYQTAVTFGRGTGGVASRQLMQGSEALVRLMTGAGKSESEARGEVKQYLPSITDDAVTLTSKIDGLKNAITRIKAGVTTGRRWGDDTSGGGGGKLPTPQNDDDYAKLHTGDHYIDPGDGKEYVK